MNGLGEVLSNNLISLVIGTLLGTELTRFLYRPNVIIQIREIKPYISDKGMFICIAIANRGRTVAGNCIGNITINHLPEKFIDPSMYKLDKVEESLPTYRLENIQLDYPRHQLVTPHKGREIKNSSLCWSTLGNPNVIDINPGSSHNLDFCRFQYYEEKNNEFWYAVFPCEQGWRKVRCRFKIDQINPINGKLFVCPNNVFPTVIKFSIVYNVEKKQPEIRLTQFNFLQRFLNSFNRNKLYFD